MAMVDVEPVGMHVRDGLVPVRMGMLPPRIGRMNVVVMMVVVPVRMVVFDRTVRMFVLMALREVEPQARHEKATGNERREARRALAEPPGKQGPHE